jgi:hypothetical protein
VQRTRQPESQGRAVLDMVRAARKLGAAKRSLKAAAKRGRRKAGAKVGAAKRSLKAAKKRANRSAGARKAAASRKR